MRYFIYSPLEMTEQEAYEYAEPHLRQNAVVHVTHRSIFINELEVGERPKAYMDSYLIRVEQDGSLRVVHRMFS